MSSWKLLTILLVVLALSSLSVTAYKAELGEDRAARDADKGQEDAGGGGDDDDEDDIAIEDSVEDAVETLCKLLGESSDEKSAVQIQKRGWLKKKWRKIKDGVKKWWWTFKNSPYSPYTVNGKRGHLYGQAELDVEKRLAAKEFKRLFDESNDEERDVLVQKRGWLKKAWNTVKTGFKELWSKVTINANVGKRGQLDWPAELDVEKRLAVGEFKRLLDKSSDEKRAAQIQKRGKWKKTWKKVKNALIVAAVKSYKGKRGQLNGPAELDVEKRLAAEELKRSIAQTRDGGGIDKCDSEEATKLSKIRDALDVLNTFVALAGDDPGCPVTEAEPEEE